MKQNSFAGEHKNPFKGWADVNIFEISQDQVKAMIIVCTAFLSDPDYHREADSWLQLLRFRFQILSEEKQKSGLQSLQAAEEKKKL